MLNDLQPDGVHVICRPTASNCTSIGLKPVFPGLLCHTAGQHLVWRGARRNARYRGHGQRSLCAQGLDSGDGDGIASEFRVLDARCYRCTPLPYIDGIRIEFNREPGAEFLGFRQGRLRLCFRFKPRVEIRALRNDEGGWKPEWEGRFEVHQVPYLKTDYIGFLVDSVALRSPGASLGWGQG